MGMDALMVLERFGSAAISGIGFVIWCTRLEGKVSHNKEVGDKAVDSLEKRITQLEAKHDSLNSELVKELTEMKVALARIDGKLSSKTQKE